MNPSQLRERFKASQKRCGVWIGEEEVAPSNVTVDLEAKGERQAIRISLGRLVLENELEQAQVSYDSGWVDFVAKDIETHKAQAMAAYLDIVRGARKPFGELRCFLYGLLQGRAGSRTKWAWVSVESVGLDPDHDAVVMDGYCVRS